MSLLTVVQNTPQEELLSK